MLRDAEPLISGSPQRPRDENTEKAPGPRRLRRQLSSGAHAPQLWAGKAGKSLARYWSLARELLGAVGGVATGLYPMGAWGRDKTYGRIQRSRGRRGPLRWEPIRAQSLARPTGSSRHVSASAAAAIHTLGSMSGTSVARKRGKPTSGARAGAGAEKRRRKVSMALLRAGIRPAPGTTVIPSLSHLHPLPSPLQSPP